MRLLPAVFLLSLLLLGNVSADDTDTLLRAVTAVRSQGTAAPAARAAWERLVEQGPRVLPRLLQALDTPDTVVANWLRTAFDRIAEKAVREGGKGVDVDALLAFARDPRRQGRARRLALDLVEQLRPGSRERLVRGRLDDPEFGHDAIELTLAELDRQPTLPREQRVATLRRAFAACRELGEARTVAARLKGLGVEVSVAGHMGFLSDWYVLGPLAGKGGKGFRTAYPPESSVDRQAEYEGKDGKKVRWKRFTVRETPAGRFPILVNLREACGDAGDAVAYAWTAFTVPEACTVEFRGSADDNLTVWVNGTRVFCFEEYRNGVRLDRHRFPVRLKAGVNTVLVKVVQAPVDPTSPDPNWEFLLRITDSTGKGLTFPSALEPAP